MVNKVEITSNRIITRDNSGNTTFDTNNLYLKTDAGGSMFIGGWSRQPVYYGLASATDTEQALPDKVDKGYPLSIIDYSNDSNSLRSWPESTTTTPWYDMYVPEEISSFYGVAGDNRTAPNVYAKFSVRVPATTPIFSVSYKEKYTDSFQSVGALGAQGVAVVSLYEVVAGQLRPQTTTRWLYPATDEMLSIYQSYGAGYYRVKFLNNWGTPYVESIDSEGTWSPLITLGNKTTVDAFVSGDFNTYPLVLPSIAQPPTNIDVAVTP